MKKTNLTDKQKSEIKAAYEFGKSGFKSGKKAAAQDANLMNIIANSDDSITIEILNGWSKGFKEENNKTIKAALKAAAFFTAN